MPELTPEELAAAETMPLEELRALALKEAEEQPRDEKGRFVARGEEPAEEPKDEEPKEEAEEEEPEQIFRKEIVNDDGTVDVYEADSLQELVDKIAEGKRQAVLQMKKVQAEKHELEKKTALNKQDEEFVNSERFKTEPLKVIQEEVDRRIAARERAQRDSMEAQSRFVVTHPDYEVNQDNARRMEAEFRRLYPEASEFHYEGLEKAYQSLKASGLLKLKAEGSEEATEAEPAGEARTEKPAEEPTQPRTQRKGSNLGTRSKPAPTANTGFSEEEAYKMPIEELRRKAQEQVARLGE